MKLKMRSVYVPLILLAVIIGSLYFLSGESITGLTTYEAGSEPLVEGTPAISLSILPSNESIVGAFEAELSVMFSDLGASSMTVSFYDASDDSLLGTVSVENGDTATYTWTDLEYNTDYYWHSTLTDSNEVVTSNGMYKFTTPSYAISEDSVYVESQYVQVNATPAAAIQHGGKYEQTFEVTNKRNAEGDLCLAYVFDKPLTSGKVWLDKGDSWTDVTSHFSRFTYRSKEVYYPDVSLHFSAHESRRWKINYAPAEDEGDNKYELYLWGKTDGTCKEALEDPSKRIFLTELDPWWAHEYTWVAGGAGDWTDQANWNDGVSGYPDGNDDAAVFNATSVSDCATSGALTVGKLTIDTGYSGIITLGGDLTVTTAGGGDGVLSIIQGTLDTNGHNTNIDHQFYMSGASAIFLGRTGNHVFGSNHDAATDGFYFWGGTFTPGSGDYTISSLLFDANIALSSGTTTFDYLTTGVSSYTIFQTSNKVLSHNNGIVEFTGNTDQRLAALSSGFIFNDVIIDKTGGSVQHRKDLGKTLTILGDLTITAGTFKSYEITSNTAKDLAVSGDVFVTGTLDCNAASGTVAASFGSLTINAGGIYTATAGTTTINSEAGGYAYNNDGTLTSSNGIFSFTYGGATLIDATGTSGNIYDAILNNAALVLTLEDTDMTIDNDLTITLGELALATHGLTVTGDADVTGTLTGNSGTVSLGTLTINAGGLYTETSGTTTVNGNWDLSAGTFTDNGGTVVLAGGADSTLEVASAEAFNNLQINKVAGTLTIESKTFDILNDFTVDSETKINSSDIDVAGDWDISAKVNQTNANVTVTGTKTVLAGTHYVYWLSDALVQNAASEPLSGAVITAVDAIGTTRYSKTTDALGEITQQLVPDYSETAGGAVNSNPYTLSTVLSGYTTGSTAVTLDQTKFTTITLSVPSPAVEAAAKESSGKSKGTVEISGELTVPSSGTTSAVIVGSIKIKLVDKSMHTITIRSIDKENGEVTFNIMSELQVVTLKLNESKKLDINRNEYYDTELTLREILGTDKVWMDITGLNDKGDIAKFETAIMDAEPHKSTFKLLDIIVLIIAFLAIVTLVGALKFGTSRKKIKAEISEIKMNLYLKTKAKLPHKELEKYREECNEKLKKLYERLA